MYSYIVPLFNDFNQFNVKNIFIQILPLPKISISKRNVLSLAFRPFYITQKNLTKLIHTCVQRFWEKTSQNLISI